MNWKIPLWTAFAGLTLFSFLFLTSPDYTIDYILKFNGVMWSICGLIYLGEKIKWG